MRIVRRDQLGRKRLLAVDFRWQNVSDELADVIADELEEYTGVLMGYQPPPSDNGVMTLMEVSTAYYARGQEINMRILRLEREGRVRKGSKLNKLRTGELRAFLELTKRVADLGSRRLTQASLVHDMRHDHDGASYVWGDDGQDP